MQLCRQQPVGCTPTDEKLVLLILEQEICHHLNQEYVHRRPCPLLRCIREKNGVGEKRY